MTVVDLYKVLDDDIFIRITKENGVFIMWGHPHDIPIEVLGYRVKSIANPMVENSIADIDIVVEECGDAT